jgi:hypothetical protein
MSDDFSGEEGLEPATRSYAEIRPDGKVLIDWLQVEREAEIGNVVAKALIAVRDGLWERM